MDNNILTMIIRKHSLFLEEKEEGEKANLREADLRGADLRRANLREADLRMNPLKIYKAGLWEAIIQPDFISIGCQTHSVKEWEEFTDERIAVMHESALEYWRENKMIVISIANSLKG